MQFWRSPTNAEIPHRITEPRAPTVARVNPSEAIRNPGLHRAITKPSYQWSAFSSCRSSMAASATRHLLEHTRRAPFRKGVVRGIARSHPAAQRTHTTVPPVGVPSPYAGCPDHGSLRLRRGQLPRLRGGLDLSIVRPPLEHHADPRGRVLGDHASDAPVPAPGHGGGGHGRARLRRPRGPDGPAGLAARPDRDHVLAPGVHAEMA